MPSWEEQKSRRTELPTPEDDYMPRFRVHLHLASSLQDGYTAYSQLSGC